MSIEKGRAGLIKPVLLIAGVISLLLLARFSGAGAWLSGFQDRIQSLGPLAPAAFVALYVIATVACVPGTVLTLMAGALFGAVWGVVWVSVGSTLGAAACFLIARYAARDSVHRWLETNDKFAALDRITEREGAVMVIITRLVPLFPFNLLNYGFGLTRVSFAPYLGWSWLCMLPGTVMYVAGADALTRGLAEGRAPWPLIVVIAALFVILMYIGVRARRYLMSRAADSAEIDPLSM
ncbi:MAG: hypothetical protein GC154_05375 [bacterium]|nr:hypothetical protein [bacterium]